MQDGPPSSGPSFRGCRQRRPALLRVLHLLVLVELDVDDPVADLLDLADVDRLDDVARFRIEHHRAARALPRHALGGIDEALALGRAAGLFERLIHYVPAALAS